MAISWDDFDKIWASTSPLTPYSFSDNNYKQGWNFVGSTPPARQMWDSIQKANDEKFKFLRDNFGTPNMVTTTAQMTDTDKIYVYVGSEAGWNNGHWYYYDAGTSTWVDGGVYNSTAFVTDATLTEAGKAADAKAVGDALALKADLAGATFTGNVVVNADFSTTGDATIANDLTVFGATTLTGNITAGADITVTGDLSVVGNATLNGTSTAVTPAEDDNSTNIATTAYVQTEIKPIEADVSVNDKRISNIEKLLQGNLYDYQTDSTEAYTKTVPAGAMPDAGLEQIGGKTLAWNQLVVMSDQTDERNGITYTTTSDGTVVINGTATDAADFASRFVRTEPTIGHVYWLRGCPADSSASTYYINTNNGACYSDGLRFTANSSTTRSIHILVASGVTANNVTFKLQFTDLTLMFGTGNEPTLDECKTLFPAESYPYNAGELLSAGVTEVVSKKADTTTIATYSIPAEIQSLDGYGWGAGTAYNYVDFEKKVLVKNVERVDLGTLNWGASDSSGSKYFYMDAIRSKVKKPPSDSTISNLVCPKYIPATWAKVYNGDVDFGMCIRANGRFCIHDDDYTELTSSEFQTAMNGVYLYYELAEPVETDISAYLSDDNLIEVEANGTLTFQNQHGADYRIPVPSTEEYMINLQEAVSNG